MPPFMSQDYEGTVFMIRNVAKNKKTAQRLHEEKKNVSKQSAECEKIESRVKVIPETDKRASGVSGLRS